MPPPDSRTPRLEPVDPPELAPTAVLLGPATPAERFDGRYEVLRILGRGGFGRVFLVRDTLHKGQLRALKILQPATGGSAEFEARFLHEIRILRGLHHPGIPEIHNDGKTSAGDLYFTMEYVEGRTLAAVLAEEAPLAPERVVRLLIRLLDVLEHAHGHGVVHRDLKPSNVIVVHAGTPAEDVRVLDFGIAKLVATTGTPAETQGTLPGLGTPLYMSPEQLRGKDVDAKSDLYALGVIVYQMCSGRLPFEGDSDLEVATARLVEPPRPLDAERTPPWMRGIVTEMLALERDQRPGLLELRSRLQQTEPGPVAPRVPESTARGARRSPWSVALRVATGALVAGAGLLGAVFAVHAHLEGPLRQRPTVLAVGQLEDPDHQATRAVLAWADIVEEAPDRAVVTDGALRLAIERTGFPWRVRDRASGIEMLLVPPATYRRGASSGDDEAQEDERPASDVTITRPFYLGRFEVDEGEWTHLMEGEPLPGRHGRPRVHVSWEEVHSFLRRAAGRDDLDAHALRLPTESEWELACRAGSIAPRHGPLDDVAWHTNFERDGVPLLVAGIHEALTGKRDGPTRPVGQKAANALGLHDMLGNTWEWCSDGYSKVAYWLQQPADGDGLVLDGPCVDPVGPADGPWRVVRGGSCDAPAWTCRASMRGSYVDSVGAYDVGFRVARWP